MAAVYLGTGSCPYGIMFVADDTTYLLLHSVRPGGLQEAGHWVVSGSWFRQSGEIIAAGALLMIAVKALPA